MKRRRCSLITRICVGILCAMLLLQTAVPEAHAQAPASLKIVIVQGDGAVNNIRQRVAREPIVEVQDENNRPVAGAIVLFTLPDRGPGGIFPNGSRTLSVVTNTQGRATASGLTPNNTAGSFEIRADATFQNRTATATIKQNNVSGGSGGLSGKVIATLAIAAGAAIGAIAAVARGNNKASSTVITATQGTVGRPQ